MNKNDSASNVGAEERVAPTPAPTVEYVKPKFKRGAISFPQGVKIPGVVAKEVGISRNLVLEKESEIPVAALKWLMADARYSGWFTKKQ
jgi:hypothetical protein